MAEGMATGARMKIIGSCVVLGSTDVFERCKLWIERK
jgi:hypothetical protein